MDFQIKKARISPSLAHITLYVGLNTNEFYNEYSHECGEGRIQTCEGAIILL